MDRTVAGLSFLLGWGVVGCALEPPAVFVNDFRMKAGDDDAWSRPEFDDSDWTPVRLQEVPQLDTVIWLRTTIDVPVDAHRPVGIFFAALASHEIWWDGERIASGGVVGSSRAEEVPGPVQATYAVPDRLATPGSHRISVRTSTFHRNFHPRAGFWVMLVGDYRQLLSVGTLYTRVALISLSGILMMAVFALMMFLQDSRDRSFLFLSLLCAAAAALLVAESWRTLFGYTYDWHLFRLIVVTALSWLLGLLLMFFLVRRFPLSHDRWFLAAAVVGTTVPIFAVRSWDPKVILGLTWVFFLATVWVLRAFRRGHPGSLFVLVGVSVCLLTVVVAPGVFVDQNLYPALDLLLLCLLGSHVLQVRRMRREREAALLKSGRLELELIKKHIQPHFLLNTLNALAEWIDREPKVAAEMIQFLGEEFRTLSDISNRRLIRMEDEIRLCRMHLEIMSRRKGRTYSMTTEGVDPDAQIPPAVIHTLVENAVTHGCRTGERVEFSLREERRDGRRVYTFTSPAAGPPEKNSSEGTGLRYVKARLQESFSRRWSLESRGEDACWTTELSVPEAT